MKRFLFIGHEANRGGAPISLLRFLRWVKANCHDWQIDLLLLRGGDLENEYREVAEVFVLPDSRAKLARALRLLRKRSGVLGRTRLLHPVPFSREYSAVVGNTVVSLEWLGFFQREGMPTVCWIHELEAAVAACYPGGDFPAVARFADRFVVPSKAVGKFLRSSGIDQELTLVYEFSDKAAPTGEDPHDPTLGWNLPGNAFVVLGSGTIEWRKGVDLFLSIAMRTVPQHPDIYFIWVGGEIRPGRNPEHDRIRYDLERMGLSDRVLFTGHLADPQKVFAKAHVFALTSREDPFPLVCLEAAMLEKPIICFADAGGIPELVEDDGGAIVPYGDTDAFTERILHFYKDRSDLARAGRAVKHKVDTRFSLSESCRKLSQVLLDVSTGNRSR